ncbi:MULTISPECIES: hypothetical protein [unclassified Acetobacter]|uniref:hypothetical protein n=1 Tax=unclassified Acetobacter TaxID=2628570 RepID=UPI0011128C98|nr:MULTISPECIES: hypothetical protein [unclassified Acetobacter]KAA8391651.1 hypothetical protein FKW19_15245 [Acetobacter sp. DmW_125128]KAA8395838.1 hypothetical protein FKW20_11730 [Acetobacter sp. DmW_125127]KAA8424199.1 hypothetical protein FKW26_02330 [Acetobacter sp. DmW_125130]KAA8435730.1 hypothetical protein FKW23_02605 [Acetobacter sp. DmW_125123]KAA8404160.1 hypothetical protein FKW15_10425 [Acetobacter sp. DmW_125133]
MSKSSLTRFFWPIRFGASAERERRRPPIGVQMGRDIAFFRARAWYFPVRLPAGGYVHRPSGRVTPVDRAWTARGKRCRVSHRLPTPLPTGSTLGTHTHRHTQQADF